MLEAFSRFARERENHGTKQYCTMSYFMHYRLASINIQVMSHATVRSGRVETLK